MIADRPSPGPEPDWEKLFKEDEMADHKSLKCLTSKHTDCPGFFFTPRGPKVGNHQCECECHPK